MNFQELQQQVSNYVYTEDNGMARIALASIISTRMKLGDPVWVLMIGPSSGGKSQILRPLALTDTKFIHRIDDLTENTFLSGMKVKKGEKDISLLKQIGPLGIVVISDFTVIFSKSSESRNAILGQFRMVYDGEMTKYSGTSNEPITWRGSLGVLAGSTPSIYSHFEEVADMGERFIYYRMRNYNIEKATRTSLDRKLYGRELDDKLADMYKEYIISAVQASKDVPDISKETHERIINISMFAALLRTPTHYDKFAKMIDKVPTPEMPMRIALQLSSLAKGLMVMSHYDTGLWDLSEDDITYIEWCAYSLANEERRACLKVLASLPDNDYAFGQSIADIVGLNTSIVSINLQHLAAIGLVDRYGDGSGLQWRIKNQANKAIIRRLEGIDKDTAIHERALSAEEVDVSTQAGLEEF